MASEDGFSDSIWPVFSAEDFDEIDKLCEHQKIQEGEGQLEASGSGQPQVQIEVEAPADDSLSKPVAKEKNKEEKRSLYDVYRRYGGFLSVTDCVGPAWCEVQYDYGLRQQRSMPLKARPSSFKTEQGKEIKVEQKVAERREKIVTAGTAVHKVLEDEQKLGVIEIDAGTLEEMWALRLLDFLTRLKILEEDSYCREVGVWGVIQDQVIFGVIDEIRLDADADKKEDSKPSPSKKAKTQKSDPQQRTLQDMLSPSPSQQASSSSPISEPEKVFRLIDTKTRGANNVPPHADTLSSRLQLMLYRHLLVDMLRADPVSLLNLWARLDCDVALPFSENFKTTMSIMIASNDLNLALLDSNCLLDMLEPAQESVEQAVTRKVSESLSLVYLRRRGTASKKSKLAGDSPSRKRKHEEISKNEAGPSTPKQLTASANGDAPAQTRDKDLIGTKKFKFNGQLLDTHMKSILRWWYGERPSEGVSVENTHRCRSCEYRDGCEWREAKARELRSKIVRTT